MSMHLFHFVFFIRNGRRKQNLIGNKITLQLMKFIPTVSISSFPLSFLPFNFSFCFCIKVIQEHILSSQMVINYYHYYPPNCPSNLDYELPCPFNPETHVSVQSTISELPPSCCLCLSLELLLCWASWLYPPILLAFFSSHFSFSFYLLSGRFSQFFLFPCCWIYYFSYCLLIFQSSFLVSKFSCVLTYCLCCMVAILSF